MTFKMLLFPDKMFPGCLDCAALELVFKVSYFLIIKMFRSFSLEIKVGKLLRKLLKKDNKRYLILPLFNHPNKHNPVFFILKLLQRGRGGKIYIIYYKYYDYNW